MFTLLFWTGAILFILGVVSKLYKIKKKDRLGLSESVVVGGAVLMLLGGISQVIIWQNNLDWDWLNLFNLLGITEQNASQIQVLVTIVAGLVALGAMFLIIHQLTITERSLRQAARASLDVVRTEHNWKLFEYEVDPGLPELPSQKDDKEYWKWRMVHLDP